MISLKDYALGKLFINEGAEGINMKVEKNLKNIITYLDTYQKNIKCIIPDSDELKDKYSNLKNWFCDYDDISSALFYLKTNGKLCMYEPNVKNIDDDILKKYKIEREGEKYSLPNIRAKLEATSKPINSAKTDLKIWPNSWNKFIVRGAHKIDETAQMPTTVIDFKNQGAYVLKDISKIRADLKQSFSNIFGEDSVLTNIFKEKDMLQYLKDLSEEDNNEVSKNMSNVLSEPLAILSLVENINNIQESIKKEFKPEDIGELFEIIIPIRQNWPVADFYAHFRNLPDRLIAVSVKSNGAGNSSTILGCLPVVTIDNVSINDNDKNALLEFFNEIVPQFETEEKVELKLSNDIKKKIQNVSLYALEILKKESKETKISNIQKLINAFENLIELIKSDTDLYQQLHKICELAGTNMIEKIFVCLFNSNPTVVELIKNAVADATSCYKITVKNKTKNSNTVKVDCIKQSPEGRSFRLIAKYGGQGLKMIVKDKKLIGVKLGHKSSQGQWLGYTFH